MKFIEKLGLALFSMIVLILSITLILIGINIVEPTIFSILISKVLMAEKSTWIMIGVCVVLALLAIRCLFFTGSSKEQSSGVLMQNSDGKLLITKDTIENLVSVAIKEFPEIQSAEPYISIKDGTISIKVILDVTEGTVIKNLSSKLQTKIKKSVKDSTDLDIESVNIEVRKVEEIEPEEEENKSEE